MSIANTIVDSLPQLQIDDEIKYGNLRAIVGKNIVVDFQNNVFFLKSNMLNM
jgi:hypothetical protein